MPTSLAPPDPEAVLLCQIPGMDAGLLQRLLQRWDHPGAILRAPSARLREAGVPAALVARIVAAPRQRGAVEAGLKSLARMGIVAVPLPVAGYPPTLRTLPEPPLLLYVQGAWPLASPLVGITIMGEIDAEHRDAIGKLLGALHATGIAITAAADDLALLPIRGSVGLLPYGLLLASHRVPDSLRSAAMAGEATLVSVAAVNARDTPSLQALAQRTLVALVDGLVVARGGAGSDGPGAVLPSPLRSEIHLWELEPEDAGAARGRARRLPLGEAGALTIARALGIRTVGSTTVQQERLW